MTKSIITNLGDLGIPNDLRVANLMEGGQFGAGFNMDLVDAATSQIFTPTVFIVTHLPTMYSNNPTMQALIKNMVESWATSISGVDLNYTLETQETQLSPDGQMLQQPGKTKRAPISPNITIPEKTGNLVWNIARKWIWDMNHPDANISQVGMENPKDMVPSTVSMSMIGLQFPQTMDPDQLIEAVLYCNMFPTETNELGLGSTVGEVKNMERSIPFTGFAVHNEYVRAYGRLIARQLGYRNINYNTRPINIPEIPKGVADYGIKGEAAAIIASQQG